MNVTPRRRASLHYMSAMLTPQQCCCSMIIRSAESNVLVASLSSDGKLLENPQPTPKSWEEACRFEALMLAALAHDVGHFGMPGLIDAVV